MKFTEIDFGGYERAADKRARLDQLFNERAALRRQLEEQESDLVSAKLARLEKMITALEETMSPLAAAKARLAQLKADLADLPQNPGSQEGYDALDDVRHAIKKQEEKIATLSEAAAGPKVRDATNDPTLAYDQARQRATQALQQIQGSIAQLTEQQQRNARDWGYPGSMQEVATRLEELAQFLGR